MHGTADETIHYGGGSIIGDHSYPSAEQTVGGWRDLDRCDEGPGLADVPLDGDPTLPGAETVRTSWSAWTVEGGGHAPHVTPAFTDALLDWLDAHSRTPSA